MQITQPDHPTPFGSPQQYILPFPPVLTPNIAIGDALGLPKASTTTRIYFQNINGITVTNPSTWDTVCTDIQHMEVDITLLAEHKLDTQQPWVMKQLHETAQ